jgi:ADP-heptose:LPS heptosyltransferase
VLGLKRVAYERPVLARIPRAGGSALPARYFVVHPFSREQAKMLADEFWLGLIARLAEAAPVVVLGSEEDGDGTRAARLAGIPAVISRIGATTFREAAGTLEQAAAFVGVDSVFAHVALAYDRPMLVFTTPASLRAAFPTGNPRALFADAAARAAGPEALAAALLKLPGVGR